MLPRAAGGRLFSDPLGRLVFALFILLSTPVGFHHQFMDPGIATEWKMLHTFNTLWILYPSFVTAFTIIASLEVAGGLRGGTGLSDGSGNCRGAIRWCRASSSGDAALRVGGLGGAINALVRHERGRPQHVVDSGPLPHDRGQRVGADVHGRVLLAGAQVSGRDLELAPMARVQPYIWFVGMLLFSFRRTSPA